MENVAAYFKELSAHSTMDSEKNHDETQSRYPIT